MKPRRNDLPVALYRMFSASGELLYIGQSHDPCNRLMSHRTLADWALEVSRIEVQWLPTKADAIAAEREAISREQPAHNVTHNQRKSKVRPRQYAGPVLSDWLKARGISPYVFAGQIGVKPERIERLIACQVNPVRGLSYKIHTATNGDVPSCIWDFKEGRPQPTYSADYGKAARLLQEVAAPLLPARRATSPAVMAAAAGAFTC